MCFWACRGLYMWLILTAVVMVLTSESSEQLWAPSSCESEFLHTRECSAYCPWGEPAQSIHNNKYVDNIVYRVNIHHTLLPQGRTCTKPGKHTSHFISVLPQLYCVINIQSNTFTRTLCYEMNRSVQIPYSGINSHDRLLFIVLWDFIMFDAVTAE